MEDHKKVLESMENDHTTISHEMLPNPEFKEQLAELQTSSS
jgi:hypothetical protein